MDQESRDFSYLALMGEVLEMVVVFVEKARDAENEVTMEAYLKMASRCLRCALEIHGEHLAEMETK